jgi:L-threonylcarbamoyladenylate synthase
MIVAGDDKAIEQAARALARGELVAFPTETVFGLGGDACNGIAVAAIFAMKQRPRFNPLIVHVTGSQMAARYGELNAAASKLIDAFWPGPLSLVVPLVADCGIASLATAGLETIALRAPAHPIARALLNAANCPIAAPSANASGYVSPTKAAHVEHDLGDGPAFILEGGPAPLGLESSVVDVTRDPPALLRPGAITREEIENVLGTSLVASDSGDPVRSPGQLASHYAPRARLRLNATSLEPGEALLAFGPNPPTGAATTINLSATGDLLEAAANLFDALRELDRLGAERVAVAPIPEQGVGIAICDRLVRAAAPRQV